MSDVILTLDHFPGDVAEAVRHARQINSEIKRAQGMGSAELYAYAKELQVSHQLLKKTAELGRLPVVNFAAGGLGKSRVYFFKDSCIHRVPLKDQICLKEIYITRFDQNIL